MTQYEPEMEAAQEDALTRPEAELPTPKPLESPAVPAPPLGVEALRPHDPEAPSEELLARLEAIAESEAVEPARLGRSDPERARELAEEGASGAAAPLPHREALEPALGTSLDGVRAHLGTPEAKRATRALGAQAYAHGEDVVFAEANPGLELVAHEVAHVVQQREGRAPAEGIGRPGDAGEREADAVAARASRGEPAEAPSTASPGSAARTAVQMREGESGEVVQEADAAGVPEDMHSLLHAIWNQTTAEVDAEIFSIMGLELSSEGVEIQINPAGLGWVPEALGFFGGGGDISIRTMADIGAACEALVAVMAGFFEGEIDRARVVGEALRQRGGDALYGTWFLSYPSEWERLKVNYDQNTETPNWSGGSDAVPYFQSMILGAMDIAGSLVVACRDLEHTYQELEGVSAYTIEGLVWFFTEEEADEKLDALHAEGVGISRALRTGYVDFAKNLIDAWEERGEDSVIDETVEMLVDVQHLLGIEDPPEDHAPLYDAAIAALDALDIKIAVVESGYPHERIEALDAMHEAMLAAVEASEAYYIQAITWYDQHHSTLSMLSGFVNFVRDWCVFTLGAMLTGQIAPVIGTILRASASSFRVRFVAGVVVATGNAIITEGLAAAWDPDRDHFSTDTLVNILKKAGKGAVIHFLSLGVLHNIGRLANARNMTRVQSLLASDVQKSQLMSGIKMGTTRSISWLVAQIGDAPGEVIRLDNEAFTNRLCENIEEAFADPFALEELGLPQLYDEEDTTP